MPQEPSLTKTLPTKTNEELQAIVDDKARVAYECMVDAWRASPGGLFPNPKLAREKRATAFRALEVVQLAQLILDIRAEANGSAS